jgi:hypothetical protein
MIQPKESNSKSHFYISVTKSGFRLGACYGLFVGDLFTAGALFAIAEVLGIAEEIF